MFSSLSHRLFWRPFWQMTHRWNWHYMKVIGPLEDGRIQAWCQWCGLRDSVYDPTRARLEINAALSQPPDPEKPWAECNYCSSFEEHMKMCRAKAPPDSKRSEEVKEALSCVDSGADREPVRHARVLAAEVRRLRSLHPEGR